MHGRFRNLLWIALAFIPLTARADGIDLPILAGLGLGVAIPLLTFNVVVEGLILGKFIGVRFRDLWGPMLRANVWSLLAGVPMNVFNALLAEVFLPREMVARIGLYPLAISLGILNYYLTSVAIEFWVLRRRGVLGHPVAPALKGLCFGHLASYFVLGPILLLYAMPKHTVQSFTNHSRWAARPPFPIVFITPTAQLQTILSDGSGQRTLLTNEVRDFVISADLNTILFRGASNHYYFARNSAVQSVTSERIQCYGEGMDFSPGARFVALIDEAPNLWVWDGETGLLRKQALTKSDSYRNYKVVWSINENVFYLAQGERQRKATIGSGELSLTLETASPHASDLASHYGRIGRRTRDRDDWDAPVDRMQFDGNRAWVQHGLGNGIRANCGANSLYISDNPGIFHFGDRWFQQAAFASNREEIIFDDGQHVYLANIQSRSVGLIAPGKKFLLLLSPFSKAEAYLW